MSTPGFTSTAKRSNADYAQVSAWIKKDTHRKVKIRLLREGDEHPDRDFSELVEELLTGWLRGKKSRRMKLASVVIAAPGPRGTMTDRGEVLKLSEGRGKTPARFAKADASKVRTLSLPASQNPGR